MLELCFILYHQDNAECLPRARVGLKLLRPISRVTKTSQYLLRVAFALTTVLINEHLVTY